MDRSCKQQSRVRHSTWKADSVSNNFEEYVMKALLRSEFRHNPSLHVLRTATERSPRLVLIADEIWLLRHLRRYASHVNIHLETLRSLCDLDSISDLGRYNMILILEGEDSKNDLYTLQCLELFWGELPVLLITTHNFHIKPVDLPSNVIALISDDLGWSKILSFAVTLSQMNATEKVSRGIS